MDINNASMYSIGFSLLVIVMASLNLVVDFDFIEEGSKKEHQNIWNGMELLDYWSHSYGYTLKF